ncbi:MAG TPA: peptidoglycan DD-metalloendopeptidase family protein [Acidimicrobiales bacterium]|nr:peptidoglycan DD-metalloendopeptidase family protein [Acidimicrobiales bacterium]
MQSASRVTARAFATALVLGGLGASLVSLPAGAAPREAEPAAKPVAVPATNSFPVPAPHQATFSDDWHACRDGCRRRHKGNDIFAPEGSPIVAVEAGVIAKVDGTDDSNGGLSIWLRGDSGVAYWYAHNSANYVTAGQRVGRGQLIGRVGHTGNARTTPSHIHFQINRCGELSSSEPCTVDPFGFIGRWTPGQVGGGADALGLYRRSRATAELRIEGGSALPAFRYGQAPEAGTLPVAGDWNADGTDTVGIYRRLDATFWLRDEAGRASASVPFGTPGDGDVVPVAGDWNGDGRDTVGLYRRADATFVLRDDAGGTLPGVRFGWPGANDVLPVVGDWDGDGRDSLGLYRSADEVFLLRDEAGRDLPPVTFGTPRVAAVPVAGDWDGDGRDTVGTYERATGTFELSGPDPARPTRGATALETEDRPAADLLPLVGDWNGLDLVTLDDLNAIFGPFADAAAVKAQLPALNEAMLRSGATTPARKAAFLATVHNESGFRADAVEVSNPSTYRGRGFIQLTGDFNYRAAGADLGVDLEAKPDLAATPTTSAQVAAWYWTVARDINYAADRFDMAAVNIAVGYQPSVREDTERCGDFVRALKWFSGGKLSRDVNCERSVTSQLLAWSSILGSGAGESSSGTQVSIEAPDRGAIAVAAPVPGSAGTLTTGQPGRPPAATGSTAGPALPPATTAPTTRPAGPGGTTTTTAPPTSGPPTTAPPSTTPPTTAPPPTTTTTTPPAPSTTTTTTVPCDPNTTTSGTTTTTTTTPTSCPTTTTTTAPSTSTAPSSAPSSSTPTSGP